MSGVAVATIMRSISFGEIFACSIALCAAWGAMSLVFSFFSVLRVYLLFNRLRRHSQRVLDCQRRARTMRDDAYAVYAEKRTAAIFFVVRLVLNCSNGTLREERAGFSHCGAHELVLEPLKHCHCDRFACFQDDIANESIAHHDLHRLLKQMPTFYITDKVKGTWFQHLEHFLG